MGVEFEKIDVSFLPDEKIDGYRVGIDDGNLVLGEITSDDRSVWCFSVYDLIYVFTASDLRAIADKLDELNGEERET